MPRRLVSDTGSPWNLPPEEWDAATAARMARALEQSGRYRVIERLERRTRYTDGPCALPRSGVFVDVETTGTAPATDKIIQLAMVPFTFDSAGKIFDVAESRSWLEDPGVPIPDEITRLTGITDEMVRGKHIDDDAVSEVLARTHLVIAHNASFDRAFCERRLPAFREHYWACSMADVPWEREGLRHRSLEMLAYQHCRMFYAAHQADSDCYMGIHLLAMPLPSGESALGALLAAAREQYVRVWAISAPIALKDKLKERGYHWSPGEEGRPRAWYRDVLEAEADAEMVFLGAEIYVHGGIEAARRDKIDRRMRYSDRVGMPAHVGGPLVS